MAREIAKGVILGVEIILNRRGLGMGRRHMEGFHEGFLCDLPVYRNNLAHVRGDVAICEAPAPEVVRQVAKKVFEAFGFEVGVDENEAAPCSDRMSVVEGRSV